MNATRTPDASPPPHDEWFRDAFDRLYPLIYRHRDAASAQREIEGLLDVLGGYGLADGALTLDIACGVGRHLAAMREAGLEAFGVDLSATLLDKAGGTEALRGRLVRGDVRRLSFRDRFDLATNLFTSFGYFEDDAANAAAMRQMVGVLKPGGLIVIDHANRAKVERELVPRDVQELNGMTVESRRAIEGDRVVKRMHITSGDGQTQSITESVRLFSAEEMRGVLADADVEAVHVMGDFAGGAFTDESPRMIVTGKRR